MTRTLGIIIITSFFRTGVHAQRIVSDSVIATPWVSVQYGINWTAGDLNERLGILNHVGVFLGWKTAKNWVYGVEGSFMFGNDVRVTGLLDHLMDSKGNITDVNGDIATVRILSRGFHVNGAVGKIFPVLSPNKNSGIYVNMGLGYVAYKLRIETQDHVVPQIELDYKKGYDRLTSGLNAHQFLGYTYMANRGAINFYGGFYIQEGFTYNRRTIFFDQPDTPVPTAMRLDVQYGLKVGWVIPIYKRVPKAFYYN